MGHGPSSEVRYLARKVAEGGVSLAALALRRSFETSSLPTILILTVFTSPPLITAIRRANSRLANRMGADWFMVRLDGMLLPRSRWLGLKDTGFDPTSSKNVHQS